MNIARRFRVPHEFRWECNSGFGSCKARVWGGVSVFQTRDLTTPQARAFTVDHQIYAKDTELPCGFDGLRVLSVGDTAGSPSRFLRWPCGGRQSSTCFSTGLQSVVGLWRRATSFRVIGTCTGGRDTRERSRVALAVPLRC